MGRKVDFLEKPKKGPGKKTKKQAPPQVPDLPKSADKKLSSRQKKRLKNRIQKKSEQKQPPLKPVSDDDDDENVSEVEPVIRMSSEYISVEILKFEFNLGSNWKMQCCIGQMHSRADF